MLKIKTEVIIITILWINILSSIFINPSFRVEFIFGIISLIIASTLLLLKKKDSSIGILFLTLFLSTFNAIKFNEAFGLSFGILNLIPLILLIILVYSNRNELINLGDKWFGSEKNEEENKTSSKIAFYKREFQNLPTEELIKKINDDKLVEEARIAIGQIIKENKINV